MLHPHAVLKHGDKGEVIRKASMLREALFAQGWRTADGQLDPVVAIPDSAGLPSAGVLNALRDLW